jgi:hypothetical protein
VHSKYSALTSSIEVVGGMADNSSNHPLPPLGPRPAINTNTTVALNSPMYKFN